MDMGFSNPCGEVVGGWARVSVRVFLTYFPNSFRYTHTRPIRGGYPKNPSHHDLHTSQKGELILEIEFSFCAPLQKAGRRWRWRRGFPLEWASS